MVLVVAFSRVLLFVAEREVSGRGEFRRWERRKESRGGVWNYLAVDRHSTSFWDLYMCNIHARVVLSLHIDQVGWQKQCT